MYDSQFLASEERIILSGRKDNASSRFGKEFGLGFWEKVGDCIRSAPENHTLHPRPRLLIVRKIRHKVAESNTFQPGKQRRQTLGIC